MKFRTVFFPFTKRLHLNSIDDDVEADLPHSVSCLLLSGVEECIMLLPLHFIIKGQVLRASVLFYLEDQQS